MPIFGEHAKHPLDDKMAKAIIESLSSRIQALEIKNGMPSRNVVEAQSDYERKLKDA